MFAFTGPVYCWRVRAMLLFPEPSGHSRAHQVGDYGSSSLSLLSPSGSLSTVNCAVTHLCKGCLRLSFSLSDLLRSVTSVRPSVRPSVRFFAPFLPPGNCQLLDPKPLTNTVSSFPWFPRGHTSVAMREVTFGSRQPPGPVAGYYSLTSWARGPSPLPCRPATARRLKHGPRQASSQPQRCLWEGGRSRVSTGLFSITNVLPGIAPQLYPLRDFPEAQRPGSELRVKPLPFCSPKGQAWAPGRGRRGRGGGGDVGVGDREGRSGRFIPTGPHSMASFKCRKRWTSPAASTTPPPLGH